MAPLEYTPDVVCVQLPFVAIGQNATGTNTASTEQTKLDRSKFWIPWTDLHNGVLQYTCYAYELPWPVGLAMVYRTQNNQKLVTADLLWIYTLPRCRRQGIARALLTEIASDVHFIATAQGSDDGGMALINAFGFIQDPIRKDYLWVKPKL